MGEHSIDEGLAAIIAAVVAALIAIFSVYLNIRAMHFISRLTARQNVVNEGLKNISDLVYQVVALSVEASKSKSDERFREKK